jgi:hypothetical protein
MLNVPGEEQVENFKDLKIMQNSQLKNYFKVFFCELWSRFGKKLFLIDFYYEKSNIINQFC